jgi:hypothetical protein
MFYHQTVFRSSACCCATHASPAIWYMHVCKCDMYDHTKIIPSRVIIMFSGTVRYHVGICRHDTASVVALG